jgi:hypothetical protein
VSRPRSIRLALAALVAAGAGCGEAPPGPLLEDAGDASDPSDASSDPLDAGTYDPLDAGTPDPLDAGTIDPPDAADAGAPMPIPVAGATYYERLLERRRVVDLFPWAQLFDGGQLGIMAQGQGAGSVIQPSVKRPWGMSFGEYTIYPVSVQPALLNPFTEIPGNILFQYGPQSSSQALQSFSTDAIIGDAVDGWWGLGAGAFFAPNEILRATWSNLIAIPGGPGDPGLLLALAGRGYKEYALGSIQPVQRTREEYAELGYSFAPYQQGGQVSLPAATTVNTETNFILTVDRDFLADGLTIAVSDSTPSAQNTAFASPLVYVRVETVGLQFMDARIERFALVGETIPRTGWYWPLPVTFLEGQNVTFYTSFPVAPTADLTVDFVLHGHLLLKP